MNQETSDQTATDAVDTSPASTEPIIVAHEGFKGPEAMIYDAERDRYLLSHQNGGPMDTADNGFISIIDPSGKVQELRWIDSASEKITLDSPKGMAIANGLLYVADIKTLRKFDIETGEPRGEVVVEGCDIIDGLATDGETIWTTDFAFVLPGMTATENSAVFQIDKNDVVTVLHKDPALSHPTGIGFHDSKLYVTAGFGRDFFRISMDGTREKLGEFPVKYQSGLVVIDENRIVVTSWGSNSVYLWQHGKDLEVLLKDKKTPAKLGYDHKRGMLLIPLMEKNTLEFHPLPQ